MELLTRQTGSNRDEETSIPLSADLLDLAFDAIIVRSLDGRIQFWSSGAQDLYGWQRNEVMGMDIHELLGTVFPDSRDAAERALADRREWRGNLIRKTRDGRRITVACRNALNREGNAVLEVNRDITLQLKSEEALREAGKLAALGRMAGIVAHEINNPLAAITNIFYLLRNHPTLDSQARHYAEMAEQELLRVSNITRQTLSFYRESKQAAPIAFHELVENVVEIQERALQANRIVLERRYFPASIVNGFQGELRQVVLNLIANAVQAMPVGGTLRLSVREATDWRTMRRGPAISITDTGSGIPPEVARRLFEPSFSTNSTKGTGLGLWISKGIVEKYNGRISYRSYSGKRGHRTCFRVFIPVDGALSKACDSGQVFKPETTLLRVGKPHVQPLVPQAASARAARPVSRRRPPQRAKAIRVPAPRVAETIL